MATKVTTPVPRLASRLILLTSRTPHPHIRASHTSVSSHPRISSTDNIVSFHLGFRAYGTAISVPLFRLGSVFLSSQVPLSFTFYRPPHSYLPPKLHPAHTLSYPHTLSTPDGRLSCPMHACNRRCCKQGCTICTLRRHGPSLAVYFQCIRVVRHIRPVPHNIDTLRCSVAGTWEVERK